MVAFRYHLTRLFKDGWAFFDRRLRITRLTEHLYLGGKLTPKRETYLRREGVRAVVSLRAENFDRMDGLDAHLWLPSPDGRPPTLEQLLLGSQFIQEQIGLGRKVYVHCHAGVGRAPTLCAAYLIRAGLSAVAAFASVKAARPWISMNAYQKAALEQCDAVLNPSNALPTDAEP
jgi:protein-tyrosine phosphatase